MSVAFNYHYIIWLHDSIICPRFLNVDFEVLNNPVLHPLFLYKGVSPLGQNLGNLTLILA
jgi:hypothetical protein